MIFIDIHTHNPELNGVKSIFNCCGSYTQDRLLSVGIHPWDLETEWEKQFAEIELIAAAGNVIAIGECGIDKLKSKTTTKIQIEAFRAHAILAEKVQKPLIIHCVKGIDETIALHKEISPSQAWIIHGFRGKPQQALQLIKAGFYISLGEHFNSDSAKIIPIEKLFIESDNSCTPIPKLYDAIAAIKEITTEELAIQVSRNSTIFKQI